MQSNVNLTATAIPKAHAPTADTAAIITLTATAGVRHVLDLVAGGYSAAPTGGSLTIASTVEGTAVSQVIPIIEGGGFVMRIDPPIQGDVNTEIKITLAAGSGAVVGKINAMTR